jgi:hypothetical protein
MGTAGMGNKNRDDKGADALFFIWIMGVGNCFHAGHVTKSGGG